MIKRALFTSLCTHLSQREISLITGPRQAGKTTLMLLLKEYLEKKGEKTVFLNLDIERDNQFFSSQTNLIRKVELEIGSGDGFVFIDEIQRKENAGLFLKGIFDMSLPYKFIVSGSGSLELKEKIHESLVGRKRIFELTTITFEEFVNHRTDYRYEGRLEEFFSLDRERADNLFHEYLAFGGYPRVVIEERFEDKRNVISDIYRSYLERDITILLRVEKSAAFSELVRLTAAQVGNLTNISELSSSIGISARTAKNYLAYLEKTFIVQNVSPFHRTVKKEIVKSSLYYYCDLGLRNFASGIFGNIEASRNPGFLFQNFVYLLLREKSAISPARLSFWRTKDGAEVDFIIDSPLETIPLEVKYKSLKKIEIPRGLRSFIDKYHPTKAYVINLTLNDTATVGDTKVLFVPYYRLLTDSIERGDEMK